ncbi:MAG: TetR/AcrR family transcriptional regulator [Succinivibrio sp.]
MGRRKKELQSVHRTAIAKTAEILFTKKGIEATSMSEIAQASSYSKATLYVYFKNKEELVGYIVMNSMQTLKDYLQDALNSSSDPHDRFFMICNALVRYDSDYPLYTELLQKNINIDDESDNFLPEEKETFLVGEKINSMLSDFIDDGVKKGVFRSDLQGFPLIMSIWAMLSGLIVSGNNKSEYISKIGSLSKESYLEFGFKLIYEAIRAR